MKKVLLINGHEQYPYALGNLNKTLFEAIIEQLSSKYEIKTTIVQNGFDRDEEIEKFQWADIVIFQTPVYWFSLPAAFKNYVDKVYSYGIFWGEAEEYGRGGLLLGKKYMLSLTWNSPAEVFGNKKSFFEGKKVDDIFLPFHKTQEFCGMEALKTFSCHNVVKSPDILEYLDRLKTHLAETFDL